MLGQLHRKVAVLFIGAVLLGACGTTGETAEPPPPPKPKPKQEMKAPLTVYEATLKPSDYDEEIDIVKKAHEEEKQRFELEVKRDSTVVVEEEVAQGFRIQIFSSSSIDEANSLRASVQQMLSGDTVYVVYDPPVYKVRVGDYVSRLEANKMLSFMLDRGFRDAWVVSDKILRRKVVRSTPQQQVKPD